MYGFYPFLPQSLTYKMSLRQFPAYEKELGDAQNGVHGRHFTNGQGKTPGFQGIKGKCWGIKN